MKILIIRNRYKKKLAWSKGIEYFAKNTPIKLEIEEVSTDWDLTFRTVSNGTFTGCVVDNYFDKLRSIAPEGKYDVICLVYGNNAPSVRVSITEAVPLYSDCDVIQVVKEGDSGKTFNHELFHCIFYRLARRGVKLPDVMDTYKNDGSLSLDIDSNRNDALKLLAPYWDIIKAPKPSLVSRIMTAITPKTQYLYFKESEVIGLKPELVSRLDRARDIAQIPFKITSGLRTVAENKKAGGVEDSSHLSGLACDIACVSSDARWKIINALLKAGFTRIGVGETFVHCDVDTSKPGNVIWHYYK